jgi:multiple antibiotic resistance protein
MASVSIVIKFFALSFSALLPIINPLGSALVFLGLVGDTPASDIRILARHVAVSTLLFLIVIEAAGALLLAFFGISLPVVQVAGGLVVAAMGWTLLNEQDAGTHHDKSEIDAAKFGALESKIFYPFTFPITAGPGTVVVLLTLSAQATVKGALPDGLAHLGLLLAVVASSILVFVSYAYAPSITARLSPQTTHGVLRVVAFVLFCIGVQITWNGAESLLKSALK